ncbi:MAG: hypothetical protein P4L53_28705 [Candidatus Obscuribacterales bacterium]|nr:hypothetical protein [Candidatus Obscuribacterales bacterium]
MKGKFIKNTLRAGALTVLLAACLSATNQANAQFAAPLQAPNSVVQWTAPNTTPTNSPLPPIGSGATAPAVTAGDTGTAPGVPSPGADATTGNIFPYGQSHDQGIVYVYHQQIGPNGDNRGTKMAFTINGGTLNATDSAAIGGILGVNLQGATGPTNVIATDDQIAQVQAILAPYPGATTNTNQPTANSETDQVTTNNGATKIDTSAPYPQTTDNGGRNAITGDNPAAGYPKTTANYNWVPVLPTVKTFCRYLVILGVVMATIWMAMAAYGMVLGMPYAGSRVLGTAMGLMMLLSAFTIWKIVQMNTYNGNTNAPITGLNPINTAATTNTQQDNEVQPTEAPGLPGLPNSPQFPARGGLPVQPLIGK